MQELFTETIVPLMPWAVLITAGLAFIVMPLITTLLNGQISIKSIAGIIALLAIIFIVYTMMPGEGWEMFDTAKYAKDGITENISLLGQEFKLMKYVETGIGVTLLLLAIAVISWIGLEVLNFANRMF